MAAEASTGQVSLAVAVLFDWQNVYNGAREAFELKGQGAIAGTVDPWQLGRILAAASDPTGIPRGLLEVRAYRGVPDRNRDPKTFAAFRSQTAAWQQAGGERFMLRSRKIKYPPSWSEERPREKGIDVWLAVDLVEMAIRQTVDRVVVVSTDTDLLPAIELALSYGGEHFVEVAGWEGLGDSAGLLHLGDRELKTRPMNRALYDRLADPTDYTIPKEQRLRGIRR